jgi:hypothetical protein
VQAGSALPIQIPAWQASFLVQALPSLHAAPLGAGGFEQAPVSGLHVPATWHWSLGVHTTGFDPVQAPPSQSSILVQALPSLHAVPLGARGFEHAPVSGSHVPVKWHWSLGVHTTGFDPVQTPPWQASFLVQALPSLHGAVLLT